MRPRAGLKALKERKNLMTLQGIDQRLLCESSHKQLTIINEESGLIGSEVSL